jgi:hypothetical protein
VGKYAGRFVSTFIPIHTISSRATARRNAPGHEPLICEVHDLNHGVLGLTRIGLLIAVQWISGYLGCWGGADLYDMSLFSARDRSHTDVRTRRGHYMGTEIGEVWYRRYRENGFFARGNGEYYLTPDALHFRRYLTKQELIIPFDHVTDIKLGKWHSGQWAAFRTVIKVVWKRGDLVLSSGFILSRTQIETLAIQTQLSDLVASARRVSAH